MSYVRGESKFSDHRPVYGIFWAEVESSHGKLKKSMSCSRSRIEVEELLPDGLDDAVLDPLPLRTAADLRHSGVYSLNDAPEDEVARKDVPQDICDHGVVVGVDFGEARAAVAERLQKPRADRLRDPRKALRRFQTVA